MKKHWGMRPGTLVFVFVMLLVLCAFPLESYAADAEIKDDNDHYVLSENGHGNGDTITIDTGCTVTIIGDTGTTYTDFRIVCGAGVHLTIQDLWINDGADGKCPIEFTGAGNTLTLAGTSKLTGGNNQPAVKAGASTGLAIGGSGSVNASGGGGGAGIGGGYNTSGGTISITGGTIEATGGETAAGIGGGAQGGGGAITLSGGTVMAAAGTNAPYDIGGDESGTGGTLEISGTAAVFLRNDSSIEPITESHKYQRISDAPGTSVYGVPLSWTGNFGAWLRLQTLTYDANGGGGTTPDPITQHIGTTCTVSDGSSLSRTGYFLRVWNTARNGGGKDFSGGGTFTFEDDATLYAQWAPTTIAANGTYLLYDEYADRVLTINPGLTVTLQGNGNTLSHLRVTCEAGVNLTIEDVKIDGSTHSGSCPLTFKGAGNTLTLSGTSTLTAGNYRPAVRVGAQNSASLTIGGSGTLNAAGGFRGAGIGGMDYENCGTVTISSGTIHATGDDYAAGIGAGADVYVNAGQSVGTINITGGTVDATGGVYASGIGGGEYGGENGTGTINISGGTVNATGGSHGAGIGGGLQGNGGAITISGGKVMATRGSSALYDIGDGNDGSGGTLNISGTAAVFLRNNACITPTTTTHTHETNPAVTEGSVYGVPCSWTGDFGAYLRLVTLTYDANGGSGTIAPVTQHIGTACTVSSASGLSRTGYFYLVWNTDAGGTGTDYTAGDTFTFNDTATLYAQWASTSITANGTYLLYDGYSGRTISIGAGLNVTLQGNGNTLTNFRIDCGAGIQLTINNVKIDDSSNEARCPIVFGGTGNTLTLSGENTLKGGGYLPGVLVNNATVLEINGSGTVNATGGPFAAGIGGNHDANGGHLTISGGTVNATGGSKGAGIGGGQYGSGGTISILGGTVNADGGESGAGIGGGVDGNSGNITISGGTVEAAGGQYGAGIGGGDFGESETILVSGGTVNAAGGQYGAGIGGGYYGNGGNITIDGGKVMAARGLYAPHDIGCGVDRTNGTLNISGTAAVFLRNNACVTPTTTHTHESITGATGASVYGVPCSWTGDFGAYLRLVTLSYDANGGSGTEPAVTQHVDTTAPVSSGGGLSRTGYVLAGWTAAADGSGADYAAGDTFTFSDDTTLYAQWLGTPTLSSAVSAGYNSIKVKWSSVPGADGYLLYHKVAGGTYTSIKLTGTSYTDTNRTTGKYYYYKVRAYRTVGSAKTYGNYSNYKYAKPIPSTPTLKAKSVGYTSIRLTWTKVSGATGYRLYRATSKTGKYSLVKKTTATSYTNTGRTTGKYYYYKVRAYRTVGSTTTYGNYSSVKAAKAIPSTPTLKAKSVGYTSIRLTWTKVSGATGYRLYRATSKTGKYSLVKKTTATSYTNTGRTTGKYYYYKVRAYRTVGSTTTYGNYSSVKAAKAIPSTPTLKAKSASYRSIKLTWTKVSGATGYILYRATSKTGTYKKIKVMTGASYTDTGRKTGKYYYYKVRAYRKVGSKTIYGSYSSYKYAKPIPAKPTSVKAVRASSKSIRVTWGAVSGASRYQVYRATSRTGTYSLKATTSNRSYTNTGLTTGKYYYYKVRAYHLEGSMKVYGYFSSVVYAKP